MVATVIRLESAQKLPRRLFRVAGLDRVVPFRVELVAFEVDRGQLGVGYLDPSGTRIRRAGRRLPGRCVWWSRRSG